MFLSIIYLLFISCKFVTDAMKRCVSGLWRIFFCRHRKASNKYQSSIMLLFEHDFRHNAEVLRVALKSMMLKCFKHNTPRGGGYCHIWAILVCAAVKGMVFKQFTLE